MRKNMDFFYSFSREAWKTFLSTFYVFFGAKRRKFLSTFFKHFRAKREKTIFKLFFLSFSREARKKV